MKTPDTVQVAETNFFQDFVDNSDLRLGKALLTEEGRTLFNTVKFELRHDLRQIFRDLPHKREEKLLEMAMIQHAISQIFSEIAIAEDRI